MHTQVTRKLRVLRQPDGASAIAPWAIVLAGGEGVRLRPLVRQFCADERPKQFAKIVGSKSLLRHTLDRVSLKIPPSKTVISPCRAHDEYLELKNSPRRPLSAFLCRRKIAERRLESCFRQIGYIRRTLKRLGRFFRRITSSLRKAHL